tara:strand:- start:34 stop:477 length:444 start_codon:yes stop_codon:yes gene_type:complete
MISCVYKISFEDNDNFYIGSTTDFVRRKREHISRGNNDLYNTKLYSFLKDNTIFKMDILFNCDSMTVDERHKLENEQIEILKPTLNFMNNNKEYKLKKRKEYRSNFYKSQDKRSEVSTCDCGSTYKSYKKSRHIKTKKHQNYLKLSP